MTVTGARIPLVRTLPLSSQIETSVEEKLNATFSSADDFQWDIQSQNTTVSINTFYYSGVIVFVLVLNIFYYSGVIVFVLVLNTFYYSGVIVLVLVLNTFYYSGVIVFVLVLNTFYSSDVIVLVLVLNTFIFKIMSAVKFCTQLFL